MAPVFGIWTCERSIVHTWVIQGQLHHDHVCHVFNYLPLQRKHWYQPDSILVPTVELLLFPALTLCNRHLTRSDSVEPKSVVARALLSLDTHAGLTSQCVGGYEE